VTAIRPLQRADLPAVAALYANFMEWDATATRPGLVAYYARTMLDQPHADPEIPTLVYEDPQDGVVGVLGSNVRQFVYRERAIRVACDGPLIVHPAHRPRGVGALLLRAYLEGPQDLTADDRAIDQVHAMFTRLGGETHAIASLGWSLVLAPLRFAAGAIARRVAGREEPPAAHVLARVDRVADRRFRAEPRAGSVEPLSNEALCDVVERTKRRFPLRPSYDERHLSWLFREMEAANVDGRLVRRLVRDEQGRPAGSYVMYLARHGLAEVIQVAAAERDAELVLSHLIHEAALGGALEVRGRFEHHLLPALRRRRCRTVPIDWACVHARDPELLAAVHGGRAFVSRLDGEWWMRPDPFASVPPAAAAPA
jgi:predicted N-acetyltransferase YhbS